MEGGGKRERLGLGPSVFSVDQKQAFNSDVRQSELFSCFPEAKTVSFHASRKNHHASPNALEKL